MFSNINKEDRQFLFSFAVLTGAGSIAGLMLLSLLFSQIVVRVLGETELPEEMTTGLLVLSLILNIIPGIMIGLGQWFELRSLFPSAGWWIAATAAGWLVGFGVGSLVYLALPGLPFAILFALRFASIGLFSGIGQWLYLKQHLSNATLWIPVAILVALIGGFSWYVASEIGGALGWIIAGGVSGYALLLLRERTLMS